VFIFLAMATALASTPQYQVIYRFQGGTDGYSPSASLLADKAGNLYGATTYGGTAVNCEAQDLQGCGTVFQLTPPAASGGAWTETVLYRFQGGSDGAFPMYAMIADKAGNLYGTTSAGGSANCGGGCGTVFKLQRPSTPGGAWTESILYTFLGVPSGRGDGDAAYPNGLAFDKSGNLFGMAYSGGHCRTDETGTYCDGAVYELTPPGRQGAAWNETILHRFHGPSGAPAGPTLDKTGNLYGRAGWGSHGFGMIFSLAAPASGGTGAVSRTYSFQGGRDAAFPEAGLVFDTAGRLFGTSIGGGSTNTGALFRLDPPAQSGGAWRESVLYNFVDGSAGGNTPNGGLVIGAKGRIYGTTQSGDSGAVGVVFELSPPAKHGGSWTETVLHSFTNGSDGAYPLSGLTRGSQGALYGTTSIGGVPATTLCPGEGEPAAGCGVVFQVMP
jgi:uncharacterized repeat protein (TIGR03803 family)